MTPNTHVVIIGGGISGLSAAYDLSRAGIRHTLLEKRPRVGGIIETAQWDDCVLETGPDSFLSAKPEALALINEVGLGGEVIGSNDQQRVTYILRHGQLTRLPEGTTMFIPTQPIPMLRSPIVGWGTKLRMGLEFLRQPTTNPDRSVAEFVTDHFGKEALDYLAEPLLSGVYGGDPAQLSINSVMPKFVELERTRGSLARALMFPREPRPAGSGVPQPSTSTEKKSALFSTLKRGLGSLTNKLAEHATIRHATAESLQQHEHGYTVRITDPTGATETLEATHIILACPAYAAAQLLGTIDARLARGLEQIPYTSSAVVTLVYNDNQSSLDQSSPAQTSPARKGRVNGDGAKDPRSPVRKGGDKSDPNNFNGNRYGTGFLIPKVERKKLMACTFVGTKFPNRIPAGKLSLRCFFGGAGNDAVLAESDESLIASAREELQTILNLTATPIHTRVSRWPRAMAQYNVGHSERLKEINQQAAAIPNLYLAGNAYTGIGIPDCIRTVRQSAKKIIEQLA
jgi:oxygen-dependent protoporphyrinogen oxidase